MSDWGTPLIERLKRGERVTFRPRGHSMKPRILDRQEVTLEPCTAPAVGDVVLCRVGARPYLHLVKATGPRGYQIGNMRGHINGWTTRIYGRVVEVTA